MSDERTADDPESIQVPAASPEDVRSGKAAEPAAPAVAAELSVFAIPLHEERRLDRGWVTVQRIGRWIRVGFLAMAWAVVSSVLAFTGMPGTVYGTLVGGWGALVALQGLLAHVWPAKAWRHASYRVSERGIEIRRGVWWRVVITVPRSRVQHTDVTQGPLERSFGLGTLVLYTAGTDHSKVELPGLAYADASAIRDRLAAVDEDDAV